MNVYRGSVSEAANKRLRLRMNPSATAAPASAAAAGEEGVKISLVLQGKTAVGAIVAFISGLSRMNDPWNDRVIPDALAQPEKPQDKDDNNDQADDVDDAVHEITFAWIKASNRMLQAIHYTPICTLAFPARTLRTPGRIKSDSLLLGL